MPVQLLRRSFTVDEFHRMGEARVFGEDDRIELLDGDIALMTPIGSAHASAVKRLNRLFWQRVGEAAIIAVQDPIRLGERSEPQPDVALVRPRPDYYRAAHPAADDVWLLVEVAETSADADREIKVPLYARAGIREVWLVDLTGEGIEVYRGPSPAGYRDVRAFRRGERLSPGALPNAQIAVDDILG